MTVAGDLNHAEAIARSITKPDKQAKALVSLVEVMTEAGDLNHAEAIARSISLSKEEAAALLLVAHRSDRQRSIRALADILRLATWQYPLKELIRIEPDAIADITTELATAWRSPPIPRTPAGANVSSASHPIHEPRRT